ncbi:hypothetical protein METBIDRAFT_32943 [Metschnikowia bicuspidata var. bicuspidata NRRL YB-4993]|uniref:DASH complex subunit ASK1 n=1 Tax=Metschnikowia bicuspidata var. bicuspidata NRRL YB-4993 TaxID=869754 RepID=A0A1A0H7G4_9ASCO|nr:hypothetical protein METBIDRAFT_32943 [Metschnikowia bicuspidata var. bicuspidata NRRL YB-4993]OBA19920.1 hypothetical protein METBIDRAFT_32943 [Metschnikowia bicuspidata var. bicuspidata NRRL YB-4993]
MSPRRKSIINLSRSVRHEQDRDDSAALELERLEQETTLVLQEIDHNLSRANSVINDKMFPVLKKYSAATGKIWENVGFWKHFMEEAADVEVKTSADMIGSDKGYAKSPEPKTSRAEEDIPKEVVPDPVSDDSSSSLGQIQASTPQQARSRALILSSHDENTPRIILRRPLSAFRRLPSSLNKSTPLRGQSETEARRLSLILKHLNSSPTLPEPPVLMSEIGKMKSGSSPRPVKASPVDQHISSSDSDDLGLGRLLPVLLPSIKLTPKATNLADSMGKSAQRFPNTPVYGSSALRHQTDRSSLVSPVQRGYAESNSLNRDEIPIPSPAAVTLLRDDDSDEIAAPQLLSLRKTGNKRDRVGEESNSRKKRNISHDDNENVFLDQSNINKSTSTIYHTMVHDPVEKQGSTKEPNSETMSQIFERVILAGPSAVTLNTPNRNEDNSGKTENINPSVPGPETNKEASADSRSEPTENLSQIANSSDMDSFFREKWKSITSNLRK